MATQFSCDPEAAGQVSATLSQIASEMQDGIQVPEDVEAAIGSAPGDTSAAQALSNFYTAASKVHAQLASLVGGSSRLLGNLAQGTQEVDQDLARELGLGGPTGLAQSGGAASGSAMQPTAADGVSQATGPVWDGTPDAAVPVGAGQTSYGSPVAVAAQFGGGAEEDDPWQAMGEAMSQLSQMVPPGATPPPPAHHKGDQQGQPGQ
jgi:hypothetical protein